MIVITGASRGIGKFLLEYYIESGIEVLGTYLTTIPEKNIDSYYKLDVTKEDEVMAFCNINKNRLKQLILINGAGITYNSYAHKADTLQWKRVIDTNLLGSFNLIKALLPMMREERYGRIINISSVVAQRGVPGTSCYAASKAGLWGMCKALAIENAENHITFNNLNLGYFDIGMIEKVPENIKENILKQIPIKRFGKPEEILSAINFIVNNEYINGTSIDINGGLI